MCWTKNRGGITTQIIHLFIGFSIINHPSILGVLPHPYFWKQPYGEEALVMMIQSLENHLIHELSTWWKLFRWGLDHGWGSPMSPSKCCGWIEKTPPPALNLAVKVLTASFPLQKWWKTWKTTYFFKLGFGNFSGAKCLLNFRRGVSSSSCFWVTLQERITAIPPWRLDREKKSHYFEQWTKPYKTLVV